MSSPRARRARRPGRGRRLRVQARDVPVPGRRSEVPRRRPASRRGPRPGSPSRCAATSRRWAPPASTSAVAAWSSSSATAAARGKSSRCSRRRSTSCRRSLGEERRCSGQGKVEMFECGSAELVAFLPPSTADARRPLHPDERHLGLDRSAHEKGMGARRPPRRLDVRGHERAAEAGAGRRSPAHRGRAPGDVARHQGLQGPRLHRVRRRRPARHAGLRPDAPPHARRRSRTASPSRSSRTPSTRKSRAPTTS